MHILQILLYAVLLKAYHTFPYSCVHWFTLLIKIMMQVFEEGLHFFFFFYYIGVKSWHFSKQYKFIYSQLSTPVGSTSMDLASYRLKIFRKKPCSTRPVGALGQNQSPPKWPPVLPVPSGTLGRQWHPPRVTPAPGVSPAHQNACNSNTWALQPSLPCTLGCPPQVQPIHKTRIIFLHHI